ncbi:basic salivary proline-rich protein 1-like [Dipodomys spectabilis]|uniref:basic salivary proline-rich protein 1-like n=1 Tax=Dipodomys spectabilis TaxID=105255 RepID=UPI001C53F4AF|nr:basic salivary proline-rich protein 1-like [Dipodomys spectabilis]
MTTPEKDCHPHLLPQGYGALTFPTLKWCRDRQTPPGSAAPAGGTSHGSTGSGFGGPGPRAGLAPAAEPPGFAQTPDSRSAGSSKQLPRQVTGLARGAPPVGRAGGATEDAKVGSAGRAGGEDGGGRSSGPREKPFGGIFFSVSTIKRGGKMAPRQTPPDLYTRARARAAPHRPIFPHAETKGDTAERPPRPRELGVRRPVGAAPSSGAQRRPTQPSLPAAAPRPRPPRPAAAPPPAAAAPTTPAGARTGPADSDARPAGPEGAPARTPPVPPSPLPPHGADPGPPRPVTAAPAPPHLPGGRGGGPRGSPRLSASSTRRPARPPGPLRGDGRCADRAGRQRAFRRPWPRRLGAALSSRAADTRADGRSRPGGPRPHTGRTTRKALARVTSRSWPAGGASSPRGRPEGGVPPCLRGRARPPWARARAVEAGGGRAGQGGPERRRPAPRERAAERRLRPRRQKTLFFSAGLRTGLQSSLLRVHHGRNSAAGAGARHGCVL